MYDSVGEVKLIDFGLAKKYKESKTRTVDRHVSKLNQNFHDDNAKYYENKLPDYQLFYNQHFLSILNPLF